MKDDELKKQEVVLDLYMLQIKASIAQIFKMDNGSGHHERA